MNHLLRSHAPITDDGWQQLEHEIQQRVVPALAARRLVDFSGPPRMDPFGQQPGSGVGHRRPP